MPEMFAIFEWSAISTMFESMLRPEVSIFEKMLRPFVVYFFLLIGLRLAGKRELAQLNAMDLVVLLTLSNTVQNAIIGPDNSLSGGLIGAVTLLAVNYAVVRFLFSHDKVDRIVEGEPAVLIEGGKLCEDQLRRELVTHEELIVAAHKQGFASLDLVEQAVLEPGGAISFVAKTPPIDELRHGEVKRELAAIAEQLAELRTLVAARG
jgi:uncharacterized membrane protein YcaP (DUF421 family)